MVVLIVASEQSVVVEDVPDRVVDLLEANGLAVECLRKELLNRVQAEAASVAAATKFDVRRGARRRGGGRPAWLRRAMWVWAGWRGGGWRAGYRRRDGFQRDAGVSSPSASCGRM